MRLIKHLLVLAVCASATLAIPAADAAVAPDVRGQGSVQNAVDAALANKPGGVQVSDNAIAWDGGNVILVIPSPGQPFAPPGLGPGVRKNTLTTPLLEEQAAIAVQRGVSRMEATVLARATADTCPGGIFTTDYYCFYENRDYGGRRLQFTGNTQAGDAVQWGFNNSISSWVSNDVDCTVKAYDPRMPSDLSNYMWRQVENSQSSWVGNADNDRLSFWNCH